MKRKKWLVVSVILLLVVLLGGCLVLLLHNRSDFSAEEMPFGLKWGMREEEVEDWLYEQYSYIPDKRVRDLMLFEDVEWEERELEFFCSFAENGLCGITVMIYTSTERTQDSVVKKLDSVYEKADSVVILRESEPDEKFYIMQDRVCSIDVVGDKVLFSVDAIETFDVGNGNSAIETFNEAKSAGMKTVIVP